MGVDGVVEVHHVIVVEFPHQVDFLDDAPLPLVVYELVLVIDLDCHVVPGLLVLGFLYDGVGALPEDFPEAVLSNGGIVQCPIL